MKLVFRKFFNKDNTFLMIGSLFLFVFIGPLLFFDIPLQADDLHYYVKFISNNLPLNQFYEFQRLPVQGAIVYYSYKMLYLFSNELKANLILAFYYFFHLFSSILLYFFIKNILRLINLKHALQLNFRNVALLTSLMFLLCPIAIDSFANTSLTARNIGLPFILLSFILKISVLEKKSLLKSLYFVPASALIFLLGLSFYEPYIILVGISFLLIYLIKEYKKALVFTLFELFFISMPLVYKLFFGLNNIESRGVDMTLLNILKHLFSYIITIFSPNLHGSLFLGSFFYSICFCLLLFFTIKNYKKLINPAGLLLGAVLCFCIIYLSVLSTNPYYVPRALYIVSPFWCFAVVLMIHLVIPSKIRFIIINTILISSVLIFFQFFFWQDTAYNVVLSIKEKFSMALQEKPTQKYSIVYKKNDNSGVRLFLSEPSSQVLLQAFIAPEKHHPALKNVRIKYELKKVSLANASIIEVVRSRFINTFVNKQEEKIELVRIP